MKLTPAKIAFLLSVLTVGVPYWFVPLGTLNLPDAILNYSLVVVFVSAAWLLFRGKATVLGAVLAAGSAPVAAVLLRVAVEVALDPTTHNLWPFEVVIAAGVGAPVALAGAALGKLLNRGAASPGA